MFKCVRSCHVSRMANTQRKPDTVQTLKTNACTHIHKHIYTHTRDTIRHKPHTLHCQSSYSVQTHSSQTHYKQTVTTNPCNTNTHSHTHLTLHTHTRAQAFPHRGTHRLSPLRGIFSTVHSRNISRVSVPSAQSSPLNFNRFLADCFKLCRFLHCGILFELCGFSKYISRFQSTVPGC